MKTDQNRDNTNAEPIEDGLSALRRLASLDNARGGGASQQDSSSQTADDVSETIPDWLELLLAKYGEQASMLVGIKPSIPSIVQLEDVADSPPTSKESAEVASLLEQMAAGVEMEPPPERPATSVDWGEAARREDEEIGYQTPDWFDEIAKPSTPPPVTPMAEETPDWLSEIGELRPETETPTEPPEGIQPSEDVLDWLQELPPLPQPSVTPQPIEPSSSEMAPFEGEFPDWLEDLSSSAPRVEAGPAKEALPETEEEVPDWMKELGVIKPEAETLEVEERPPSPEGEALDWLRDLGVPARQEAEAPQDIPVTEEGEVEIPDWLARLTDASLSQAEEALVVEPSPSQPPLVPSEVAAEAPAEPEAEVPDWLRQLESIEEAPAVEPSPPEPPPVPSEVVAEAPAEPEAEVPDWLRQLESIEEAPAAEAPPPEPPPVPSEVVAEAPTQPEVEMPDWLRELESVEEVPAVEPSPPEPPSAPPEVSVVAPAEADVEVPDWLRELESVEEVPAAEPSPPGPPPLPPELEAEAPAELEADVPDWLRELQLAEEAPPAQPAPPEISPVPPSKVAAEAPAEPEAEVPDWLASLRDEQPSPLEVLAEEDTSPVEYPGGEMAEEPNWLAALRISSKADLLALDEEVVEAEEEALPDWLAELRSSQAAAEGLPPSPGVLEEIPEYIEIEEAGVQEEYHPPTEIEAEIPEVEEIEPSPVEAEYPVGEEGGALDWLVEIEAAATEYAVDEIPTAKAEAPPVQEEIPDWLRQMPPADLTTEAGIPETEKETVETRRPPEWLVSTGEEEVSPLAEEAKEIEEAPPAVEGVTPAEIPDWLQTLKPEEGEPTEPREEEVVESEGVLAGMPGLLPIVEEEPEGEEEPIEALRSRIGVPEVPDVEGAKLFREIVTELPAESLQQEVGKKEKVEARTKPESRRGRLVANLAWALIFIILIVAIALALMAVLDRVGDLLGGPAFREFFGSPMAIDPAPVNTFRAQVTRLPPDAVVVVSFDYSPATEAEMGPLAQIILRDLLESQARVVAVSLRPEGPAMAQHLFERFESEYPYGQRTINLGYLPGQTAGVRSLAFLSSAPLFQNWTQTLDDYPAWQDVDDLSDVALIVALADSPLAVRWWVEQMGPGTFADRPIVAAVSTAADPSVRPYYNQIDPKSGQLLGLVSGVTGAAAYENRLGQSGRAVESLAAQSVAHLGLVVVTLGGTVMGFRTQAVRE
jgi:hypothetical protein